MSKCELTKTIEATRLNKRTMRPLGGLPVTIPYGAMLEDVTVDRDNRRFVYLGEPYECPESVIGSAIRPLEK
jgi:hypothetical protein